MTVYGSSELVEDVQKKGLCVGCGGCVALCPYFGNYRGKTAQLFPCTLPQGRCHAFCPKTEVDLDALSRDLTGRPYTGSPLGGYREIVAARAGEKAVRGPCQAGGTVTALIGFALESGVIEAAALTDRKDAVARGRLVTTAKEAAACAGSKFMAAPTLAAFNQGVAEGISRLGVVGTPCQVTSVAQMRTNPLGREDFADPAALVIGLFCTWALDTRGLLPLLDECVDSACILGMDMPPPPREIMVIDTGEETVEIPLERVRPLIPAGCHICPDMTSEFADISVGVLEGRPDTNTLIVRSERGKDLVDAAVRDGVLATEPMPEENLGNLTLAAGNKKRRAVEKAKRDGLLNTGEEQRSALRIPREAIEAITGR